MTSFRIMITNPSITVRDWNSRRVVDFFINGNAGIRFRVGLFIKGDYQNTIGYMNLFGNGKLS
jgi:hypothetical protein